MKYAQALGGTVTVQVRSRPHAVVARRTRLEGGIAGSPSGRDSADLSDTPVIAGIYSSRSDAEQVAEECRCEARDDYGWVVYGDKDVHGDDIVEWDVDVHVEEHLVQARSGGPRGPRLMRPRYNHLYALGFSVDSNDSEGATEAEVLHAIRTRLIELRESGEALEAVGVPDETIDNETGLEVDHT